MQIPYKKTNNGIIIKVKIEPKSSKKGFAGFIGDTVKIKLNSPPVEGAANKELIEFLSKELNIRKSSIIILTGKTSKNKVLEIRGIDSLSTEVLC